MGKNAKNRALCGGKILIAEPIHHSGINTYAVLPK